MTAFKCKNAAGVLGITGVSVKVGTKAPFLSKVTVKGKNLSIPGYPSNPSAAEIAIVQLRPGSPFQCGYWDYLDCLEFSGPTKLSCKKIF